jgi:hypothetical protein
MPETNSRRAPSLNDLLAKAIPEPNSGCFLWGSCINAAGYGLVKLKGRSRLAHRAIYEMTCGPVPAGLDLDHLCRVRSCVNPAHLEPVTRQVNASRGIAGKVAAAKQLAKTHCPQGHPYDGGNLYLGPDGRRGCRACRSAQARAHIARKMKVEVRLAGRR